MITSQFLRTLTSEFSETLTYSRALGNWGYEDIALKPSHYSPTVSGPWLINMKEARSPPNPTCNLDD